MLRLEGFAALAFSHHPIPKATGFLYRSKMSSSKSRLKLKELQVLCKEKSLSIKDKNKHELEKMLSSPDDYRLKVGGGVIHCDPNGKLTPTHAKLIKDNYDEYGHPSGKNIEQWRKLLEPFDAGDAVLYGAVGSLKKTAARGTGTPPMKRVKTCKTEETAGKEAEEDGE